MNKIRVFIMITVFTLPLAVFLPISAGADEAVDQVKIGGKPETTVAASQVSAGTEEGSSGGSGKAEVTAYKGEGEMREEEVVPAFPPSASKNEEGKKASE